MIFSYMAAVVAAEWKNRKKCIIKIATGLIFWCGLVIILQRGITCLNGGHQGSNHYIEQFGWLFPISLNTFLAGLNGMIYYVVFFIFCVGILPCLVPVLYRNTYTKLEQKMLLFIYASIALMIVEIVVTIFLTEERGNFVPHKFLFRYFFGFGIPLLIMTWKVNTIEWKGKGILLGTYGIVGIYIAGYYWKIGTSTRTAIMDSHVTLLLENVNKFIWPGFPVWCALGFMLVALPVLFWSFRRKDFRFLMKCMRRTMWITAGVICIINLIQHPYYSNQIGEGKENQDDFTCVAEYLGKDDRKVYYLNESLNNLALVYGYLWQDYKWITDVEEIGQSGADGGIVILTEKGRYESLDGFVDSGLDMRNLKLWVQEGQKDE